MERSSRKVVPMKKPGTHEEDPELLELERLILAYQYADTRDRQIVWAVLNRYMPEVDRLTDMQI